MSQYLKGLLFSILVKAKDLMLFSFKSKHRSFIHKNLNYYTQDITGAKDNKDHIVWKNNGCGMACLKMILEHALNKKLSIVELGKMSLKYGCYTTSINQNRPWYWMEGLFYQPFTNYLNEEFKLKALVISPMVISEVLNHTDDNSYVIASVIGGFSDQSKPDKKRGHLVLVSGYDLDKKMLLIHNPSWLKPKAYKQVTIKSFKRYFANRGVVVKV